MDKQCELCGNESHGKFYIPGVNPDWVDMCLSCSNTHFFQAFKPYKLWESPTLEELAQTQNVVPIVNVKALFGTWPGEPDDGFEAAIDDLRHGILGG